MVVKDLLPSPVRKLAREMRSAMRYKWHDIGRKVRESVFIPPAKAWLKTKDQLNRVKENPDAVFELCLREFGVGQKRSEILGLLEFLNSKNVRVVCEIGTKTSGNAFLISTLLESLEHYVGIDIWLNNTPKVRFFCKEAQQCTFIQGNSSLNKTSRLLKNTLQGKGIDFLFIDGDHSYAGCARDFVKYYELVNPGGLIGFHDIVPDEKAKTGAYSEGETHYGGGVHRVWSLLRDEFKSRDFIDSNDQFAFGIGVITKPGDDDSGGLLSKRIIDKLEQHAEGSAH